MFLNYFILGNKGITIIKDENKIKLSFNAQGNYNYINKKGKMDF